MRYVCALWKIGTLRSNDANGNENVKKTIGLISKTTTLHVHHAFLYISFLFLHDYDVKMPNFAFYRGRKQATTKLYFSFCAWLWALEIQLQEGSPTLDVVVASLDLKVPNDFVATTQKGFIYQIWQPLPNLDILLTGTPMIGKNADTKALSIP